MIALALDTATDRCSVAATDGTRTVAGHVDGARRHNAAVLPLATSLLTELGATPADVRRILTADGPGSFTGLRVAAAVAKALTWERHDCTWAVAPSLLVRALAHAPAGGGTVLALADALRGELYGGLWHLSDDAVRTVLAPRTLTPAELPAGAEVVVGSIPEALRDTVATVTGRTPVVGPAALPDAAVLFRLDRLRGGTHNVADPGAWEPTYGRPAEAQAVWERTHGKPLPAPADRLD